MKGQVDGNKKEKSNGDDEGAKMTMMGKNSNGSEEGTKVMVMKKKRMMMVMKGNGEKMAMIVMKGQWRNKW